MRVQFDNFTFDPESGELWLGDQPVPLATQPAQVLGLLVDRAGHLVARETIREAIWTDRVIDFDQGINACIRDIRRALAEDCDAPRFIETLPRKGYRFVAPVRPEPKRVPGAAVGPIANRPAVLSSTLAWLAAVLLVLAPAAGERTQKAALTGVALEHYQAGRMWLSRHAPEAHKQAVERLQQATTLAPGHADAWAALALAWLKYPDRPERVAELAESAARLALSLEPGHAEALLARAHVAFHHDWDWERARSLYRRAAQADPNHAGARQGYGSFLVVMGETEAGLEQLARAYELAPLSTVLQSDISWLLTGVGRPREALDWCDRLLSVAPQDLTAVSCAYRPRLALGDERGAVQSLRAYLELRGVSADWLARVDPRYPDAALEAYREWRRETLSSTAAAMSSLDLARIEADEGHIEQAIAHLKDAIAERDPLVPLLALFPEFQPLADEPGYREVQQALRDGRLARRVAQCIRPSAAPLVAQEA